MSIRNRINVVLGAILLLTAASTCGYERGKEVGKAEQTIAVDKESLTTAHKATTEATVNAEKFNARVDEAHAKTETARKALAPIRERVAITPKGVSVDGDTTASVVIPALVSVIQHQDTLQFRSDSEIHAQQFRHVADTVLIGAAKHEVNAATKLATDQAKISHPRCGRNCGILIGVGSVAVALIGLHQMGIHF